MGQNSFRMTHRKLISFPRKDHANVEQSVDCHMHQEIFLDRDIPSFRMRAYRVERLIPKRDAAPFGPMITPRVCCSVLRMCSRFKSSRVMGSSGEGTCVPDPSLARGQQRVGGGGGGGGGGWGVGGGGGVVGGGATGCQYYAALDEVLQLSDISRPRIGGKGVHHFRSNPFDYFLHSCSIFGDKVCHQQRDVFCAIT